MNRFVYGVAVSALVLGTGGIATACEQHARSAALQTPAAAALAHGFVLAQTQTDEQGGTTGEGSQEESKPDESKAVNPAIGPLAQSQDDSAKEAEEEKEKKPEALPGRARGFLLAQSQDDDKKETTGEDTKPEGDDQK